MFPVSLRPGQRKRFRLPEAIHDARLVQIVRRHLQLYTVPASQPDEALAHLAGDVREYFVFVLELNFEHRASKNRDNGAFEFNGLVAIEDGGFGHVLLDRPFAWRPIDTE